MSVSLEQFPAIQMRPGVGDENKTFSNIKTPVRSLPKFTVPTKILTSARSATSGAARLYRPRYALHAVLLASAVIIVANSSPAKSQAVAMRLDSESTSAAVNLDSAAVASIAADVDQTSGMMIAPVAQKTAATADSQVALLTSDDDSLAKRQVVSTAGNPTRDITTYTVAPGDTLSGIASKFDITTNTILWANSLGDVNMVAPGQVLTILPTSGLLYTVQAGDTAAMLASKFQANAAQILSYNDTENGALTPGVQIIVPEGVKPEPVQVAAPVASTPSFASSYSGLPQLTHYAYSGNGYSFGYCTYYVATRRNIPSDWGNANQWYYNAQSSGFKVGSVPEAGAIAWTGAGYYGHVAYVESVEGSEVTISEMNYNGNWDRVTERTVPASEFLYIY